MSSTVDNQEDSPSKDQGFVSHLLELRDRLIRVVLVVLILFGIAFTFWIDIYDYLSAMVKTLDGNTEIKWQNISPAGGFFTAIRISTAAAFFVAMPYIFFQLWNFVAPGLYQHERKLVVPILSGGIGLFYLGILFARYVVLPIFYGFAGLWIPSNTENIYDIMKYLDFNIKMFFAFGIAFQVPIVTIVLVWGGISTPESLRQKRPYVIVGAFVVGMLLTPPDVVSQVLLAIPMWILFELGILVSQAYYKPNKDDEDDDDPDDSTPRSGGPSGGIPGSAAAASAEADKFAEEGNKTESDEVSNKDAFADDESMVVSSEGGMDYPYDYKPLNDDELDAELDRFDEEMDALEEQQTEEQQAEEQQATEQDSEQESDPDDKDDSTIYSSKSETSDDNSSPDSSEENKSPDDSSTKKDESNKNGDKN